MDVLRSLGLEPDGILGHSVGELGCGYADGSLTAEETVLAAYWRGRCILESNLPTGGMAAVGKVTENPKLNKCEIERLVEEYVENFHKFYKHFFLREYQKKKEVRNASQFGKRVVILIFFSGLTWKEAKEQCPSGVTPACHNTEQTVTISGPLTEVQYFIQGLKDRGVFAREVNCSGVAFHSYFMKKIAPQIKEKLKEVTVLHTYVSPKKMFFVYFSQYYLFGNIFQKSFFFFEFGLVVSSNL